MQERETLYRNFYEHCGTEWDDVWSCMCNDRCPVCNREIEPGFSETLKADDSADPLPKG